MMTVDVGTNALTHILLRYQSTTRFETFDFVLGIRASVLMVAWTADCMVTGLDIIRTGECNIAEL
jgi:hypothetical protein